MNTNSPALVTLLALEKRRAQIYSCAFLTRPSGKFEIDDPEKYSLGNGGTRQWLVFDVANSEDSRQGDIAVSVLFRWEGWSFSNPNGTGLNFLCASMARSYGRAGGMSSNQARENQLEAFSREWQH